CGDTIGTTREAFENIRVRQRHYSLGTLLGEAIRISSRLSLYSPAIRVPAGPSHPFPLARAGWCRRCPLPRRPASSTMPSVPCCLDLCLSLPCAAERAAEPRDG
ncbi:hypothetical protein CN244_32290, partial [Sinorhizobium medicae]